MEKRIIDKPFGPFGTSTGIPLAIGGIVALFYSFTGLILIIIGLFIAFTRTSAWLDPERKRIRLSNDLFGIIPSGKWITINPEMGLRIRKAHRGFRGYIRVNDTVDIHYRDYRVCLVDGDNKRIGDIAKADTITEANKELTSIARLLGLQN